MEGRQIATPLSLAQLLAKPLGQRRLAQFRHRQQPGIPSDGRLIVEHDAARHCLAGAAAERFRSPAGAVNRATIAPASSTSSRVILPPVPAHSNIDSLRSAHRSTTADQVDQRGQPDFVGLAGVEHCPGAVGRRKNERLAAHCSRRVVAGGVAKVETVDFQAAPLSSQDRLAGGQVRGRAACIVDFEAGNHLACAGRQGRGDGGGRPQDVDHHRHAAGQFAGSDQLRQKVGPNFRERHLKSFWVSRRCPPACPRPANYEA